MADSWIDANTEEKILMVGHIFDLFNDEYYRFFSIMNPANSSNADRKVINPGVKFKGPSGLRRHHYEDS